jgi:hypothetical protein
MDQARVRAVDRFRMVKMDATVKPAEPGPGEEAKP